jgi:predicted membrane protein
VRSVESISTRRFQPRPQFTVLALGSFIVTFAIARVFTHFYPGVVLISGGIHFHHFWFGLLLLAVGGWLGINYNRKEVDMVAAIVYGVGGGLIVDELGLLLTFGDYYSGLTWTFLFLFLAFVTTAVLLRKYREKVYEELHEFIGNKASLYIGVLMAAVSVAFIVETDNLLITFISVIFTVAGILIILAFLIHQLRKNTVRSVGDPKNS